MVKKNETRGIKLTTSHGYTLTFDDSCGSNWVYTSTPSGLPLPMVEEKKPEIYPMHYGWEPYKDPYTGFTHWRSPRKPKFNCEILEEE